jgi:hypothetical protein
MLALSRMDRMTRTVVFGVLAFAGSFLLGESYLPTASYFWGLGAGRLLFCLLLVALPATDAGRFRPLLVILAGASFAVAAWASSFLFARWALLTLLYLAMEVSLDALVLNRATEQEVPFELGWLAGCRLCGLWMGLFVQYAGLTEELRPRQLALSTLLAVLAFWIVARESSADRFVPLNLEWEGTVRQRFLKHFKVLGSPWTLTALAGLGCYACLAGYRAGAILPYPLLHPQGAGSWMSRIIPNLATLAVGLLGSLTLERLRLRNQLWAAAALTCGLELSVLIQQSSPPSWLWGLLLTSILLSSRAVLRETYSVDPVLRAATVVTVWVACGLWGQYLSTSPPTSAEKVVGPLFAVVVAVLAAISWSRYAQPAKELSTLLPPARGEARFGDRKQDFEAAPEPRRKSRPATGWRRRVNSFLLHLPMYLTTILMVAGSLKLGSYIFYNKQKWEKQLDNASRRFQTELLLSALERRLQEEMLASQRVPKDWNQFISSSFNSNGKPLTDIDLWNTPYRFENIPGEIRVVSAGPDRIFETEDDLERSVTKPEGV